VTVQPETATGHLKVRPFIGFEFVGDSDLNILKRMDCQASATGLKLRSRAQGRERWVVPCILGHPEWAATIETIVGSEDGIQSVVANPETGRVLIEFNPSLLKASIQILLQRAVAFRPMTAGDGLKTHHPRRTRTVLRTIIATELGCSIFKLAVLGLCPCKAFFLLPSALLFHRVISDRPRPGHRPKASNPKLEAMPLTAAKGKKRNSNLSGH
jgi:hypothetical protein